MPPRNSVVEPTLSLSSAFPITTVITTSPSVASGMHRKPGISSFLWRRKRPKNRHRRFTRSSARSQSQLVANAVDVLAQAFVVETNQHARTVSGVQQREELGSVAVLETRGPDHI